MKKSFEDGYHKVLVQKGTDVALKTKFNNIPYSKVSRLNTKYSEETVDLLDILVTLPKPARDLFVNIKRNMNWMTNEAMIPATSSPAESVTRSRALKSLKKYELVRRIKGNAFMISPYHLVPKAGSQQDCAVEKWELIK